MNFRRSKNRASPASAACSGRPLEPSSFKQESTGRSWTVNSAGTPDQSSHLQNRGHRRRTGRLLDRVEVVIIREALQNLIVTGRLKVGQHPLYDKVHNRRCVPDIEIKRDKLLPQAIFRLIIESGGTPPFVFVGDRPYQDIARNDMIEVKIESDFIIEAEILRTNRSLRGSGNN